MPRGISGRSLLALAAAVGFAAIHSAYIIERIAIIGFSPLHYVAMMDNPVAFARDWPNGMAVAGATSVLAVLFWLHQLLPGIGMPSLTILFSALQLAAMVLAMMHLAKTLFHDVRRAVFSVSIALCSPAFGVNIGNFGAGLGYYSPYLYYHAAHAAAFLGLSMALRQRWVAAGLLVGLATTMHVTVGVFAATFLAGIVLSKPECLRQSGPWMGGITATIIAVLWLPQIGSGGESANAATWLRTVELFNYHFLPVQMGFLGARAHELLAPLILVLVGFVAVAAMAGWRENDRAVTCGVAAVVVLSVIGLFFPIFWPLPTIIKIGLPRASMFASALGMLYLTDYLGRRLTGEWLSATLALWALSAMALGETGIVALPIALLLTIDAVRGHFPPKVMNLAMICCLALATVGWTGTPHWRALALGGGVWQVSGPVAAGLSAAALLLLRWSGSHRISIGMLVVAVMTLFARHGKQEYDWHAANGARAEGLMEAAEWARRETPPGSLYMSNPASPYTGWRDLAQRPVFGLVQEWGMSGFLYRWDHDLYAKGSERLKLFGFDLDAIDRAELARTRTRPYFGGKLGEISTNFNATPPAKFRDLAQRFGIDYLVIEHADRPQGVPDLESVHTNGRVTIYRLAH